MTRARVDVPELVDNWAGGEYDGVFLAMLMVTQMGMWVRVAMGITRALNDGVSCV